MNDEYEDSAPPTPSQEKIDAFVDAAEKSDTAAVTAFLGEYAAFIDQKSSTFRGTALIKAASEGKKEMVELLLAKGAQVDARDQINWTPLIEAAEKGHTEIVALLLGHGAQIDAVGQEGDSALMRAALRGHTKTVELLLEKGANIAIENNRDQTALMHAGIWGDALEIASLIEKWPETRRQRKEKALRRAEEHADAIAQERAADLLYKLKSRRPPQPPFKKKM